MSLQIGTMRSYQKLIIFASIVPLMVFGFLIYNNSKQERINTTFKHIKKLNDQKKEKVIEYFESVEFHTKELAKTVSFLQEQATQNIINIQQLQKNHIENHYQSIENDILSLAKKDVFKYIFSFLERGKNVSQVYLDNIYAYKEELKIKNVLMINKEGKILYSSDNQNLLDKNASNLTEVFRLTCKILKKELQEKVKVSFVRSAYNKLTGTYQEYAVAPFESVDGYIAIEINQNDIQKIIQNVASLGNTAETYLVYEDENTEKTYLATNRTVKKGQIGDEKSGYYIDKGFSTTGTDIKYGSLGDIELVGYTPVEINNAIMSMQTTVAYTEIISPTIDGSDYFEQFIRDYNYENVMLIGSNGSIFYSVNKDKQSQPANLLEAVKEVFRSKQFVLTDIAYSLTSSKKIAQFALLPILKKDKTIQSIVVIELNFDTLGEKLEEKKHIYESYETYILGSDLLLRSDTHLNKKKYSSANSCKGNIFITTQATKNVFKKQSATQIVQDYRGKNVLLSSDTIDFPHFKWAIISEVDEDEVEAMVGALKYTIAIFVFISSIISLIIMYLITNEKKKQDETIHYNATHDALTGLANRKFALEFLSYILANLKRRKKLGAVLYIDLDKFKIINDSYGHKAGDIVLREISNRLKNTLRKDDLIARLGGDEFILIINDYENVHDIDVLCKKIIKEVSLPIQDEEKSYQVGISIGIATFPNDSMKADELLQFSDTAMFSTKENGRNNFTYYSKEMTEKSLRISRVESELKNAINSNELMLHYQPQVSLITGKVIGIESLIRWNHPQDGLIMPNEFIPIAEESTLILDVGYWVVYEACKTFKEWKNNGSDLEYIAVNMSTKQLQCPTCVVNIQTILKTLDFKAKWLELEITETTLITNLEATSNNIEHFKNMGIKFSIDDFGTGYSSLSYLKSLSISTLKIDREFIKDMVSSRSDRAIVEAIILMGHTLNYTIVAEGAETKAEMELLKYLGCDIIQGNYFSKPLPQKELLTYIQGRNNAE